MPALRLALLLLAACAPALAASPDPGSASDILPARLGAGGTSAVLVGGGRAWAHPDLFRFYAARSYAPGWERHGEPFLPLIEDAADGGLDPAPRPSRPPPSPARRPTSCAPASAAAAPPRSSAAAVECGSTPTSSGSTPHAPTRPGGSGTARPSSPSARTLPMTGSTPRATTPR